jgi:hypothetical protein
MATLKRDPGFVGWMEGLDGGLRQSVDGVGQGREHEGLIVCIRDPVHAGAVAVERAAQRQAFGAEDGVVQLAGGLRYIPILDVADCLLQVIRERISMAVRV